jgi:hypothetical protein
MRIAVLEAAAMIVLALAMFIGLIVRRHFEGAPKHRAPVIEALTRQAALHSPLE